MQIRKVLLTVALVAACKDSTTAPNGSNNSGSGSLRVINANATTVDVLVDGVVTSAAVPAGQTVMLSPADGQHNFGFRATGSSTTSVIPLKTSFTAPRTIAARRAQDGSLAATVLDDTASIVPFDSTKVRVLHLATSAGELQVFRTQPGGNGTPVAWQTPFTFQTEVTGPGAPFYQSPVGTWEIRIWQTPTGAAGWVSAPIKLTIPLGSKESRTVVITDKPGGGIQAQVIN
ncbi:MAG: DUF4397 domain-containing protein [Gemmatimonadaceae bacterium]